MSNWNLRGECITANKLGLTQAKPANEQRSLLFFGKVKEQAADIEKADFGREAEVNGRLRMY